MLTAPIKDQPTYGIGLLVVHNPQEVTDSFYKLHFNFISNRMSERNNLRHSVLKEGRVPSLAELDQLMWKSRHHEYKFSEVTKHNLQQYIDLMNLYFSFPNLEFHSLIVDRAHSQPNLGQWGDDPWHVYISLARELLKRRLKRRVFAIVDLQGKPKDSLKYLEEIFCSLTNVAGCLRATSDMSVFLQIVDVLLGCVHFDWKDQKQYYGTASKRAEAKRELTAFIKSRLGVRRDEPILTDERGFRRWTRISTFTAWRWHSKMPSEESKGAAMSGVHPANGTTHSGHSALPF